MFTGLVELVVGWLSVGGYPALAVAMALESMVVPLPSEAVMPFAGFLVASGQWTWLGVAAWSTVGSLIGSGISYALGYYVGRPVLLRYGRYVGLAASHLEATERWFARTGGWAVLVCRFIPVVRHLSSIPAGAAKMRLAPFLLLTATGACLWNVFLAWVGYSLGERWDSLGSLGRWVDVAVVILLIGAAAWWWKRRRSTLVG